MFATCCAYDSLWIARSHVGIMSDSYQDLTCYKYFDTIFCWGRLACTTQSGKEVAVATMRSDGARTRLRLLPNLWNYNVLEVSHFEIWRPIWSESLSVTHFMPLWRRFMKWVIWGSSLQNPMKWVTVGDSPHGLVRRVTLGHSLHKFSKWVILGDPVQNPVKWVTLGDSLQKRIKWVTVRNLRAKYFRGDLHIQKHRRKSLSRYSVVWQMLLRCRS